jgi:DNA modification methylase
MYVQHTVEILREIRRVLRSDGTCWWNIGDSHASGKGTCINPGGGEDSYPGIQRRKDNEVYPLDRGNISTLRAQGLKPLDRCLIPFRVALAAQADGWYVRMENIWEKNNPMPESVAGWRWVRHKVKECPQCKALDSFKKQVCQKCGYDNSKNRGTEASRNTTEGRPQQDHDGKNFKPSVNWVDCPGCTKCLHNDKYILKQGSWRPAESHEYILLLTKTNKYYGDGEAVRENQSEGTHERFGKNPTRSAKRKLSIPGEGVKNNTSFDDAMQSMILPNGRNMRSVWEFPTQSYPDAHFATFPEELPERCIKASTPEYGVCAKCGAPWARVIDHDNMVINRTSRADESGIRILSSGTMVSEARTETIGWKPTCKCYSYTNRTCGVCQINEICQVDTDKKPWEEGCAKFEPKRVPAKVLDPFCGSGTTLQVATRLGRESIGYELSKSYCNLIVKRCKQLGLSLI